MSESEQRAAIEAVARSWLGTPYHPNAGIKGVGCDCLHLLVRAYAEAGLIENFDPQHTSPQFFLHNKQEVFLEGVLRYSREIAEAEAKIGDVVLYKIGLVHAHGAIIVSPGWPHAIIHAHAPSRCVIQTHGRAGELAKPIRQPRFFTRW